MQIMKTILVDDEPFSLEVLKHMLTPYKKINIIGSYTKAADALEAVKKLKPEIIFLDIELGEINGLELAEIFLGELEDVEIVFVTAYSQYAVDAFEINAIDYLLKPIQERRLEKAINRLKERKAEKEIYAEDVKHSKKLKINSFGGFEVFANNGETLSWRTQKSKELFAYLWTRRGRISSKDAIIEAIFPARELEKANTILHTTVYQLRKNLEKLGHSNTIIYSQEGYQLAITTDSDLGKLIDIINQKRYRKEDIMEIIKIYRGDFLEEGYPWAGELQETYRQLVFKTIEKFAEDEMKNSVYNLSLKVFLDKLYQLDPLSNSAAEMIIDYYGGKNEISKLKTFYEKYKKELKEELELKPTSIIRNKYKQYIAEI